MHFTRVINRTSRMPFTIKGDVIRPKQKAKILGVIMDAELRFKKHMAEAATRGLTTAICLKRLKMVSPRTARQLFTATVAPAMDYASVMWSHARGERELSWFNRAQKMGTRAITGAFRTVATAVAEAEASIQTVCERHAQASIRTYVNIKTLPKTHPLAALMVSTSRRYMSPLKKLTLAHEGSGMERMETIEAYARRASGYGRYRGPKIAWPNSQDSRQTLGSRDDQNQYTTGLEAIAMELRCMPDGLQYQELTALSGSQSSLKAIVRPRQQSGEATIGQIYEHVERLRTEKGKQQSQDDEMMWVPSRADGLSMNLEAKRQGQEGYESRMRAAIATIIGSLYTAQAYSSTAKHTHSLSRPVGQRSKV
ncbi:reverse transcriptase [Fusarium coicis]|nr:reverse transcriptase [Fusarium coicis]